jgi:2-polyprenyl-6-methoxyphenol hydroxylase-like FAD-dependent oxidoreductase
MFDEIIVGAGSAGAVIAARLSEDGSRSVLLVEAGPDYPSIDLTPKSILNGRQLAMDHDWGFCAEMIEGRTIDYARGKVVGGSSADGDSCRSRARSRSGCSGLRSSITVVTEFATLKSLHNCASLRSRLSLLIR